MNSHLPNPLEPPAGPTIPIFRTLLDSSSRIPTTHPLLTLPPSRAISLWQCCPGCSVRWRVNRGVRGWCQIRCADGGESRLLLGRSRASCGGGGFGCPTKQHVMQLRTPGSTLGCNLNFLGSIAQRLGFYLSVLPVDPITLLVIMIIGL